MSHDNINVRVVHVAGHTFRATFPDGFAETARNAMSSQILAVFESLLDLHRALTMLDDVFAGDLDG